MTGEPKEVEFHESLHEDREVESVDPDPEALDMPGEAGEVRTMNKCLECGEEYQYHWGEDECWTHCPECSVKLKAEGRMVTEEGSQDLIKRWYKMAKEVQGTDSLVEFIDKLNWYIHDYGTIVHAMTAAAIAAAWVVDHGPSGGITGFQASCVMWQFISEWMHLEGHSLRMLDFDNMLFPQYADYFAKRISASTWEDLQTKAQKNLDEEKEMLSPSVKAHWESIVAGVIPFGYRLEGLEGEPEEPGFLLPGQVDTQVRGLTPEEIEGFRKIAEVMGIVLAGDEEEGDQAFGLTSEQMKKVIEAMPQRKPGDQEPEEEQQSQ